MKCTNVKTNSLSLQDVATTPDESLFLNIQYMDY
jgi:hypothetical protein